MRILFAHTNHPAQFGAFGAWLAAQGWDVVFATARSDARPAAGARLFRFKAADAGAPETHRHARPLDRALRTAESFAAAAVGVRDRGFTPDVVVAHSGWGAGTYAKAVWPSTRFVPYIEWWYSHPRVDMLPGDPPPTCDAASRAQAVSRNAPMLLDLVQADLALCPTSFQAAQLPDFLRARLHVAHDGVDCATLRPDPQARARLAELGAPPDAEIVTYAARGLEPHRGFPEFMRALAHLQKSRPRLFALIVGEDRAAYGAPPVEGGTWKARMLGELDLDHSRLRFTGHVPAAQHRTLLQGTDLHVYLTVPFVLSWSFIEAISIGAPLLASDAAPVHEALGDSDGALLVDHADVEALAAAMARCLDAPAEARARGGRARLRALATYDRARLWPHRADLLASLAGACTARGQISGRLFVETAARDLDES